MIKVDHITKQFKQLKAVDDVSLEIEKGEIVCLIGPSGSGKSTVLRCIHGLEKPEKGEVYIDGQLLDPSKPDYMTLRRRMGFVFQHFHLFPNMSVMDNLKPGADPGDEEDEGRSGEDCRRFVEACRSAG